MAGLLAPAQRVNTTWRDAVAQDRRRYSRPSRAKGVVGEGAPLLNPLLLARFSPCFFDFDDETWARWRRAGSVYTMPWTGTGTVAGRPRVEELRFMQRTGCMP
ncbi:hypothetical protein PG997_001837 [Apiospora hydei]|uniref:Uncharacterized protein n=1 Tax=Apiospora hydei TaxID=1337664 RepID=A0ABR1X7L3_9PEZI